MKRELEEMLLSFDMKVKKKRKSVPNLGSRNLVKFGFHG